MSVWNWAADLPPIPAAVRITLGEGNTPLVRSRSIGPSQVSTSCTSSWKPVIPTNSYKDRFAAVAISDAVAQGKRKMIATSSGNTGAALAAYAAAAGLQCDITLVEHAPADKLRQMLAYGANLYRVRTLACERKSIARCSARWRNSVRADSMLCISAFRFTPVGMNGVKTIAFELAGQLPTPPAQCLLLRGGGGMLVAVGRGFAELVASGRLPHGPAVECVQPVGNATIAGPLVRHSQKAESVDCTTRISGLQVASVIDGDEALQVCVGSGGRGHLITDEEAWEAQRRLAREEGIFCEPAAAVPLAGALCAVAAGELRPGAVVCLVTGSGFKDLAAVDRMNGDRIAEVYDVDAWCARLT